MGRIIASRSNVLIAQSRRFSLRWRPHQRRAGRSERWRAQSVVMCLALALGLVVPVLVAAMKSLVGAMQAIILGINVEHLMPARGPLRYHLLAGGLCCAGLLAVSVNVIAQRRYFRGNRKEQIDALEANALYGGEMSWRDGTFVVPILVSASAGASVGTEAAVTQVGAVLASVLGRKAALGRSDLRLLVGAGAAAAISAAFHAPGAGMFYAFELVLGVYSKRTLAPIALAAIASSLIANQLGGGYEVGFNDAGASFAWSDYLLASVLGTLSALVGVAFMYAVIWAERLFKRLSNSLWLRIFLGGLLFAGLAVMFPGVLGSGHAGIEAVFAGRLIGLTALGLLVAKIAGSAICLGSGYRGGLFSASLMVGALLGEISWEIWANLSLPTHILPEHYAVIGMACVAASVIGSPLCVIALAIEISGRLEIAPAVALGGVISSLVTNRFFGYSFATWRFQQRGLSLDGGQDVSLLSATSIETAVRPPKQSLAADADFASVVRATSAAGGRGTSVHSEDGAFLGLVDPQMVEERGRDAEAPLPIALDLVFANAPIVTTATSLEEVMEFFRIDDRATLAVVSESDSNALVGCIRARDVYRMVTQIIDSQRREDLGIR